MHCAFGPEFVSSQQKEINAMKKIIAGDALRHDIVKGAATLAEVLIPNYGPPGRNTLCQLKYDIAMIANSGRKILDGFSLSAPTENLGAVILRDAALQVGNLCGDGTITTVVLAHALLQEGEKAIVAGADPMQMRKGMEQALCKALEAVKKQFTPCDAQQLRKITFSAAKDGRVGALVYQAMEAVGTDGVISVQDSQAAQSTLNVWDGVRYDYGLLSAAMATDPVRRSVTLCKPAVVLVNQKIKRFGQILKLLEQAAMQKLPVLLICSDMDEQVLTQLTANVKAGKLQLAVAKAPGHGDTRRWNMLALVAKTGALLLEQTTGRDLTACGLEICGSVDKAIIDMEYTLLQGFPMESAEMIDILGRHTDSQLRKATLPDEAEALQTTLAILKGKIAEITVGDVTEYGMFEKKFLTENAAASAKAAGEDGVLPGGGTAYLYAARELEELEKNTSGDILSGVYIMKKALCAPFLTLENNLGENGSIWLQKWQESYIPGQYFDVKAKQWCPPAECAVLDTAKSAQLALTTATSAASTLLTAAATVLD